MVNIYELALRTFELTHTILYNIRILLMYSISAVEPKVMWLSGLHIPESYLTALVQSTCRKNGWPLDKSTLYTNVKDVTYSEEVDERPESGD